MCGIVGIISKKHEVTNILLDGLSSLAYRGYDSAGIAVHDENNITRERAEGKLENLVKKVSSKPLQGKSGIGHTRWATHGAPNEANAHPHMTSNLAMVHNGIIENHEDIKQNLSKVNFESETDTEAVVFLLDKELKNGKLPKEAVANVLPKLQGAFSLAILFTNFPDLMIVARKGSPLAIGHGDGEMLVASDGIALASRTKNITYLEEGDWAIITADDVTIFNNDKQVERNIIVTSLSGVATKKDGHQHFMHKEIFEQPSVLGELIATLIDKDGISKDCFPDFLKDADRLHIVACGSAYYAGLVGLRWIESFANKFCCCEMASEFRIRDIPFSNKDAVIIISQSGETMDTLLALRKCKEANVPCAAIVNVPESTISREADFTIYSKTGPESAVASTKAFSAQLLILACLAQWLANNNKNQDLIHLPDLLVETLACEAEIKNIAMGLSHYRNALFMARGILTPLAYEGALKLKEISYIHAEGYASGEMKHGPIALADEHTPIIALAPFDGQYEKIISNVQEAAARNSPIFMITSKRSNKTINARKSWWLNVPDAPDWLAPIIYSIPVQLLAYHTALQLGTDIDQPRNLAKSVTVE